MSRSHVRIFVVSTCAVLLALLSTLPGIAESSDTPQASLDDVIKSLGIASSPVDYVVIVDTSGSMQDSGLYPKVRTALGSFLRALKPTDHLSLLTFDTAATLRYTGTVGSDPQAPLNQLPPTATGQGTDIGAGIETGIAELERPNANTVSAIVLITDGKIQAPDSAYSTPSAPAWDSLQERAGKVASKHKIVSYALALESTTDAALLKKLFADALVFALPNDQIEDYLNRVSAESIRQKAIQALEPDLGNGVEVTMRGPLDNLDLGTGTADFQVTFRSTYAKIPVTISPSVNVTGDLPTATASGLPPSIDLRPGQSEIFTLRLTFPTADGFRLGEHPLTRTGRITLADTISSPWHQAITSDLGLAFTPKLKPSSFDIKGRNTTGWSWFSMVAPPLLALVIVICLIMAIRRSRMPRLVGVLEFSHEGKFASDFPLGGKVLKLGKGARSVPGQHLRGSVRGLRRRDETDGIETGVRIHAKSGRARNQGPLFDGDSLEVGDVTITYKSS